MTLLPGRGERIGIDDDQLADPASAIASMLRPMTSITGCRSDVRLNSTTDVPAAISGL